jgi:hypothetical protein
MEDWVLNGVMYGVGIASMVPIVLLRRWFRYLKAPGSVIGDSEKNSLGGVHFFTQSLLAIVTAVSLRGQWDQLDAWLNENGLMIFAVIAVLMLAYSLVLWAMLEILLRLFNPRYKAWKKAGFPKDAFLKDG